MQTTFKLISALLSYPETDLINALPEIRTLVGKDKTLAKFSDKLLPFLDHLANTDLIHLQETYVQTFDRNRNQALYLFEHIHGEDRDRGGAMVDLIEEFKASGFEPVSNELPDYLPVLLEFFSLIEPKQAKKLLGDAIHVIAHIGEKLESGQSQYAALLEVLVVLSPVTPEKLIEPPVRDMDEAMETFGPNIEGIEPLLRPNNQAMAIKFYPNAKAAL